LKKQVNIDSIVAKQQAAADANKAKRVRFYKLQRELHGITIDLLMTARPSLSTWDATQIVYNANKFGVITQDNVDPLFRDDINDLILSAQIKHKLAEEQRFKESKYNNSWTELQAKYSQFKSNQDEV
jgi:hypothetical protein